MAADRDVVVVGGGLAGAMSALSAVRSGDASVTLVTAGDSTLELATGLIDVMGYTPGGEGPLADPFSTVPYLPAEHPYTIVGESGIKDGLELFDKVTGELYCGGHTEHNALIPTYSGYLKPTARYPRSMAAGMAGREASTTLVGFDRLTAFDAQFVADQLHSTGPPGPVTGMEISFPIPITDAPAPPRYATALEANEPVEDGTPLRTAFAEQVQTVTGYMDRVAVPAVLGWESVREIREAVEAAVDAPVYELPMGPPSVPGGRLGRYLHDALLEAGVDLETKTRVTDVRTSDGAISAVELDGDRQIDASAYVLATGGVAGGGIETSRDGVREPLFGCHVEHPADRTEWVGDRPLDDQPFARFGVIVDLTLRPLGADTTPEFSNLYAAGDVIGGYNYPAEKSGGGVSIATGYVAGQRALE